MEGEKNHRDNDIFVSMQSNRIHQHPNFYRHDHDGNNNNDNNNNNAEANTRMTAASDDSFTFIVMADTQLGMLAMDEHWDIEMQNCQCAIEKINALQPRPLFCCICGDLINMTSSIYAGRKKPQWATAPKSTTTTSSTATDNLNDNDDAEHYWTEEECNIIQEKQYNDFTRMWRQIHPDIALVCVCGNHDVGNRPTLHSIQQYTDRLGNDYLSFWGNPQTCFLVINTSLFNDYSNAIQPYHDQLVWLEQQLHYARHVITTTKYIFILAHHPLFIYDEKEEYDDLINGINVCGPDRIPDGYFHIPKHNRQVLLDMFKKYNVTAYFCGHFHQNMISKASSFNMDMIISSSISSVVLQTTGPAKDNPEPKTLGYRIVDVTPHAYTHHFVSLYDDNQ